MNTQQETSTQEQISRRQKRPQECSFEASDDSEAEYIPSGIPRCRRVDSKVQKWYRFVITKSLPLS